MLLRGDVSVASAVFTRYQPPFALSLSKGERQLIDPMQEKSIHASTSSARTDFFSEITQLPGFELLVPLAGAELLSVL